jgi:aspartokinase-like uncharacterized kinase
MLSIIKIGGSLARKPSKLIKLCNKLQELSEYYEICIIPGGGPFVDIVRTYYKIFSISDDRAHKMAILGMDQYGLLLYDLFNSSILITKLDDIEKIVHNYYLAIILPSKFLLLDDYLEHSWDVTSDSISAYIAGKLNANRLILIKDVDGIYSLHPSNSQARLIRRINVKRLENYKYNNCIDKFLPFILKKMRIRCFIVNGFFPNRLEKIFKNKSTTSTEIYI